MASQDKLFLIASVDSSNALTELFDFVWPNAVALWNLQWQAKGFLAQMPDASVDDLNSRFVLGSKIRGANLHRLANQQAWSEMQQWFSRLLLSEVCALFEGWIESALDELALPQTIRKAGTRNSLDKHLQFPTSFDSSSTAIKGGMFAVAEVQGSGSSFIQNCMLPTMAKSKKNSTRTLEKLLVCYRVFKEARNDFTHHGGRASQRTVDAYAAFAHETASSLGINEKPELPPVSLNNQIQLSLRGVVGFSDVVLRLIATFDLLLSDSAFAENVLKKRWREKHGGLISVKPPGKERDNQLAKLIRQCNLPTPTNPTALYTQLHGWRLVV